MKNFPKITISKEEWYRARHIDSGKKLKKNDMGPPDPTKTQIFEGRYNHFGQSHWYLAKSEKAAAKEKLENNERMIWLQRVYIKKAKNILDVRRWWHGEDMGLPVIAMGIIFSGALEKPVERNKNWKPEYFVPRFIADSAKYAGFNGILFNSDRHYDDNLVLLKPKDVDYDFKDDPYIYETPVSSEPESYNLKIKPLK